MILAWMLVAMIGRIYTQLPPYISWRNKVMASRCCGRHENGRIAKLSSAR